MNTAEHERLLKHAHWVNEISNDPTFLDHIKDQLTVWEINRLLDHINHEIGKNWRDVSSTLLLNPGIKYGKDFTIEDLEKLKRVKPIVEAWKWQQETTKYKPPEPHTITTVLYSQMIINRVFRNQLTQRATPPKNQIKDKLLMGFEDLIKQWVIFNHIYFIAPFEITDFTSFHKSIIEIDTNVPKIRDIMKRILASAEENISLYKKLQDITPDAKESAYYKIDRQNKVSRLYGSLAQEAENNPYQQVFTNDQLFDYCDAVADFMRSCMAKPDPEAPDQIIKLVASIPTTNSPIKNKRLKTPLEVKPLRQYIRVEEDQKEAAVTFLKTEFSGLKGKKIAFMITAMRSIKALRDFDLKNLCESLHIELGDIGKYEGIRKYIKPNTNGPKQKLEYNQIASKISGYFLQKVV
jgi:hypothetical protein